jgi:integrase
MNQPMSSSPQRGASNHAMILSEACPSASSKGDFDVARRRFQNPKPRKEGRWWILYFWQDEFINGERRRKKKRTTLAPGTTPEREVRKIAAEFLRPVNQGLLPLGSATGFSEYVDTTYIPVVLEQMAASTKNRYEGVIKNYLRPQFGGLCLRDITTLSVDRYLAGLGTSKLAHESLDKIRDVLSSILVSAVRYGLLVKNPAEGVRLPHRKSGRRAKPWITRTQFDALVGLIAEPYASMMYVAVFTGLRVSELVGLRWRNVHQDTLTIEERYCRGDWGAPKSAASNATIPVNRAVIERIHRLKTLTVEVRAGYARRRYRVVKSDGPDDLVFQSVRSGAPMRDNTILVRHIKPVARSLNLGFVNWRCLRTSYATWLKLKGADIKDSQALMRHSRASTTLDFYQQFVPESQRRVVDGLMN